VTTAVERELDKIIMDSEKPVITVGVDYGTGVSVEVFAKQHDDRTIEIIDVIETKEI
jgi:hypothetical protein